MKIPAKKKPAKKRKLTKKPRKSKDAAAQLLPPLDFPLPSPKPEPEKPSLLSGLSSILKGSKPETAPASGNSSTVFPAEPLSVESERLLAAVPDVIGDELPASDPALAPGHNEEQTEVDELLQMVRDIDFQQEDIQYLVEQLFEMIAEWRQMEHWKLTERQSRILGRPLFRMVNVCWAKLVEKLPDYIVTIPGLAGTCLALGIVATPKILKDRAISTERAHAAKQVGPGAQPGPKTPTDWKPFIVGGQ